MTSDQAAAATPYQLLCALAAKRGWKVRLGLAAKEKLATGHFGPPLPGESSLVAARPSPHGDRHRDQRRVNSLGYDGVNQR